MARLVGIFGGTFDPVHNAHLRVALDVAEAGDLDQVRLIPCHIPPHRDTPEVTAARRLEMLSLGAADEPRFVVDDRELRRDMPSYTVDTLRGLREAFPDDVLCLLLGADSFHGLPRWHRWQELSDLAHLVIMERPATGTEMPESLGRWLPGRQADDWAQLRRTQAGLVLFQTVTQLDISATELRRRLAVGGSGRYLMPDAVWRYIQEHGLYCRGGG